jgi:hypothetical protein
MLENRGEVLNMEGINVSYRITIDRSGMVPIKHYRKTAAAAVRFAIKERAERASQASPWSGCGNTWTAKVERKFEDHECWETIAEVGVTGALTTATADQLRTVRKWRTQIGELQQRVNETLDELNELRKIQEGL